MCCNVEYSFHPASRQVTHLLVPLLHRVLKRHRKISPHPRQSSKIYKSLRLSIKPNVMLSRHNLTKSTILFAKQKTTAERTKKKSVS